MIGGILFRSDQQFDVLWNSLLRFTECLDLTMDMGKTRVWSTHAVARNLGAHQNFTRHCWNSVLQQRLATLPAVWMKLRASLSPYRFKHTALRMMGWPKALHGCSVVHVGGCHFKKLRSGAMKGLRPALHLIIQHLLGDPEAWAIMQTIRDARELGGFVQLEAMLALYGTVPLDLPRNGPTAVLVNRLQSLGWTIGGNGLIQDAFGSFNLVSLGFEELLVRFTLSWGVVLEREVGHRTTMHGSTLLICLSCMLHWGNMARVTLPSCVVTWMGPCMSIMVEPSFSMMLPINVRGAQTEMVFVTELGFAPILLLVVAILPQTSCLPSRNCHCVCLSMVGLSFCQSGRSMSVICWIHLIRVVALSSRLIMVSQMNGLICLLMAQHLALRIPNSAIRCMGRHPGYWRSW